MQTATYVSVFDDWIVCESACKFDPATRAVFDIEMAPNADSDEVDAANSMTDEFVRLASGLCLREEDGVVFVYRHA